ncbi:MAG: anti-sigma factor family protein, partial [bacterium]
MQCSEFEKRLSAFLNGDLSAEGHVAMATHLESCPECCQTAQIVRGDFDLEPEDIPENFVSEVLELTSGDTCQRARHQLSRLADGELSADYAKVVANHLQTCTECCRLFAALTELAYEPSGYNAVCA